MGESDARGVDDTMFLKKKINSDKTVGQLREHRMKRKMAPEKVGAIDGP